MTRTLLLVTLLVLAVANSMAFGEAVLTRGVLTTTTGGDNKDHDTCVWVTVTTSDGSSELASIQNGDCGGDDSTEYNDHSTHTLPLMVQAAGASKQACKGIQGANVAEDAWRPRT